MSLSSATCLFICKNPSGQKMPGWIFFILLSIFIYPKTLIKVKVANVHIKERAWPKEYDYAFFSSILSTGNINTYSINYNGRSRGHPNCNRSGT